MTLATGSELNEKKANAEQPADRESLESKKIRRDYFALFALLQSMEEVIFLDDDLYRIVYDFFNYSKAKTDKFIQHMINVGNVTSLDDGIFYVGPFLRLLPC